MMFWVIIGIAVTVMMSVDITVNRQSYRDLGLRIGDACRSLWFWPTRFVGWLKRLAYAHEYHGHHRKNDPMPPFMRHWQSPRPWQMLRRSAQI